MRGFYVIQIIHCGLIQLIIPNNNYFKFNVCTNLSWQRLVPPIKPELLDDEKANPHL